MNQLHKIPVTQCSHSTCACMQYHTCNRVNQNYRSRVAVCNTQFQSLVLELAAISQDRMSNILCQVVILSVVKAWVGLTAAKIARAVRVCTRHRMLCNCGLLNTATLMFTFA